MAVTMWLNMAQAMTMALPMPATTATPITSHMVTATTATPDRESPSP